MKEKHRVGAILSAGNGVVNFLGFGTHVGSEIPPVEVNQLLGEVGIPNPKIQLDNGNVVWGCQCWWGDEEAIKAQLEAYKKEGYIIEEVTI